MVFSEADLDECFVQINHDTKQVFIRQLVEFAIRTNMKYRETGYEHGFYIHDAHVVGMLLYPHLYTGSFQQVEIETMGKFTRGETVVDMRNHPRVAVNTFVATSFHKNKFLEALTQDLRMFDFE